VKNITILYRDNSFCGFKENTQINVYDIETIWRFILMKNEEWIIIFFM